MSNRNVLIIIFAVILVSCGDLLESKKEIYRNYYLLEGDRSEFSLYYRTENDDYIRRVSGPISGYILVSDSILIAKRTNTESTEYYLINIKADNSYADENIFLINKFSPREFNFWQSSRNIKLEFTNVK